MIYSPQLRLPPHADERERIKNFLSTELPKNAKVLDVGGGANCWGLPFVTHVIDVFHDPVRSIEIIKKESPGLEVFNMDIDDYKGWEKVEEYCDRHGLFDFIICTHTLEDLNAPFLCCEKINALGRAGYIALPTKYAEFCKFENYYPVKAPLRGYKGCHHHRWVYQLLKNKLIGYPKQGLLEFISSDEIDLYCGWLPAVGSDELTWDYVKRQGWYGYSKNVGTQGPPQSEFNFLWKDTFEFEFVRPWELIDNRNGPPQIEHLIGEDDLSAEAEKVFFHNRSSSGVTVYSTDPQYRDYTI